MLNQLNITWPPATCLTRIRVISILLSLRRKVHKNLLSFIINCPISDLQTALSLRVLLIHDPLLLSSLLLLPASLSCLLALSMSLLQEVLLHTGPVSVSFLFPLGKTEGEQGLTAVLQLSQKNKK